MSGVLAGLEHLPLAVSLRTSVWLYPIVNTAHIAGIALLFGAIVPYDLRILGLWPGTDRAGLARILLPVATFGLALAVAAGSLLFIARASDYLASSFFLAKMAVLALALVVALVALLLDRGRSGNAAPAPVRLCAGLSILLWLGVMTLGRLIGYF